MKNYKKPCDFELRNKLSVISYRVTQRNLTEEPFSSPYNKNFNEGIYVDVVTGEPLFSSKDKLDLNSGWPDFSNPISDNAVREFDENSFGIERIELRSVIGNSHLGYLFKDSSNKYSKLRYSVNGAALNFIPKDRLKEEGYEEFCSFFD